MTGGFLGEIFASLSFAGALVASISLFQADRQKGNPAKGWEKIGLGAFWAHGIGVLGVIGTLFGLIYTHQYQYHYVWSHSSNELPVHFMISCFWEGQEGSFLLWTFWHAILGFVIMFTAKKWRNIVLSVLSSVNLILASMILGVYVGETGAKILFSIAVLVPVAYLTWKWLKPTLEEARRLPGKGFLNIYASIVGVLTLFILVQGNAGFFKYNALADMGTSFGTIGLFGYYILVFGLFFAIIATIAFGIYKKQGKTLPIGELLAASVVWILGYLTCKFDPEIWKIGSSPFVLLAQAMPNAPVFASNPDFVPANGTGLNPLLQNYWMVIHPPTLFLGFASTAIPFSFVIAGLIKKQYKEWIRPAMPWLIFSAMVLGVGIIMGGYWAYETLNFGGYWNWDPVENSSFVPWLIAVSSIHGILAYKKSGIFLKLAMIMVISTFLLVLYSTFLTRSGILGDTSVHTFTDLGLSGQLILLLMFYVLAVSILMLSRWKDVPVKFREIPLASAEFILFLGTLTLIFIGLVVIVATSVPVLSEIFDANLSTIRDTTFFYYKWTIWFAIGMGFLSGIGQFLFWRRVGKKRVRDAMARPFVIAAIAAMAVMIYMAFYSKPFAFEARFDTWLEDAEIYTGFFSKAGLYLKWVFFVFADEMLLFASFFAVFANLDILISLLRRNERTRKVSGGSIAHIGFALMLLGILFSSGYDEVISKNLNPAELPLFNEDERVDNVVLQKNLSRFIRGFEVTYTGKKEAEPPVSNLQILNEDGFGFKVAFEDKDEEKYAMLLPKDVFAFEQGEIDLDMVEEFLNDRVAFLKPKMINDRTLYGIRFVPTGTDKERKPIRYEDKAFTLYPEAEVNPNMGLVAHPARKIYLNKDVYVHVSSVPKQEEEEPKFKGYQFSMAMGDTVQTARAKIYFEDLTPVDTAGTGFDLIARAKLRVLSTNGQINYAEPQFRIDPQNRITVKEAWIEDVHSYFIFTGVDLSNGKMNLQVQERENPPLDYVVLKAIKKPGINILWLGTFVLTFGFGLAMFRRISESRRSKSDD